MDIYEEISKAIEKIDKRFFDLKYFYRKNGEVDEDQDLETWQEFKSALKDLKIALTQISKAIVSQ